MSHKKLIYLKLQLLFTLELYGAILNYFHINKIENFNDGCSNFGSSKVYFCMFYWYKWFSLILKTVTQISSELKSFQ